MKKLSSANIILRDNIVAQLEKEWATVLDEKQVVDDAIKSLNSAIHMYNGIVQEVTDFRDEIVASMTEYQGDRSDKWNESEAGQNYQAWIDDWENLDTEEVEEVEEIDFPEASHADELGGLPEEPSS